MNEVARTTMTISTENKVRMKRQALGTTGATLAPVPSGCQETVHSYTPESSTPQSYSVWSCSDGNAFVEFGGGFFKMSRSGPKFQVVFSHNCSKTMRFQIRTALGFFSVTMQDRAVEMLKVFSLQCEQPAEDKELSYRRH